MLIFSVAMLPQNDSFEFFTGLLKKTEKEPEKSMPGQKETKDLTLPTPWGVFNHRVGILVFKGGAVLAERGVDNDFLPGGRVSFGESSVQALMREAEEELRFSPASFELACVVENFFSPARETALFYGMQDVSTCHEIGIYYRIDLPDNLPLPTEDTTGRSIRFIWMPLHALHDFNLKPAVLKEILPDLKGGFRHIICRDGVLKKS